MNIPNQWFCHQNPDHNFNACSIPEEDIQLYDQLAERCGLTLSQTQYVPGDLVWVKMDGYCRWPGIVIRQPERDPQYSGPNFSYKDGKTTFNHVEFLGQPHSHGWVSSKKLMEFTPSSVNKQHTSCKQKTGRKWLKRITGCRYCEPFHTKVPQMLKTGYSIEYGINEAMKMFPLSLSERLKRCTFHSHLGKCAVPQVDSNENDGSHSSQASESEDFSDTDNLDTAIPWYTSFDSCLENRTKEERLLLDAEMYKQNERAFFHDIRQFMIRNELKPFRGPFWENRSVDLFQLFLAVQEHGGHTQVTCQKKWAAVYREVTETNCHNDFRKTNAARLFYYRHLYPYELYVQGKDFTKMVSKLKEVTCCPSEQIAADHLLPEPQRKRRKLNPVQRQDSHSTSGTGTEAEEDIASDSLREMLQALDENSKLAFEDVQLEKELDITFSDDSPPADEKMLQLTDYGVQGTTKPVVVGVKDIIEEGASSNLQPVFQHLENASQACSLQDEREECSKTVQVVPSANDNGDDDSSASSLSQRLLKELDVLQDAINVIDDQIDWDWG
ncbi:uncharacterized protein LOC143279457 [Babylonia areolata]|uniref:uncharacterized protein LOC143279457 n=1 Tax=Babylonia areolata TaxID=304850 RepID=UPI003FCF4D5F